MRRLLFFGVGVLVGVAVGTAAATLLAPASGDDLRKRVENHVDNALSEARLAADKRRRELEAQLEQMMKPGARPKSAR